MFRRFESWVESVRGFGSDFVWNLEICLGILAGAWFRIQCAESESACFGLDFFALNSELERLACPHLLLSY